ncbi:cytochrome P450 [Paenibacillus periandrae]|uniref:cytochrome P450 n=1 Tax=Paenibacillus periandrae TaxID=1761741 RepID=UPI001F09B08A|nr:cytochrome P450 [Paenibacillus periandrae]
MFSNHTVSGLNIKNLLKFRNNPLHFLTEIRELGDIVEIGHRANRKIFVLNHPDLIKEVLVNKTSSFRKGKGLQIAGKFLGQGLLTSEGDTHKRQRRLMQPQFHAKHISSFAGVMVEHTERMLDTWVNQEDRNIHRDMTELALEIINKTMFGHTLTEDVDQIGEIIEAGSRRNMQQAKSVISVPKFFTKKTDDKLQESQGYLNRIIYSMIEERRKQPYEEHHDLLSLLLAATDEDGTRMTDQEIRDQLITIYIAGHETTANTLSWTWFLLAQNATVEKKLWAELDEVLGGNSPSLPDIPKLKYTNQIIQESMRLYPAAWMIGREATEPVEIGGMNIAQGDTIFMSQYAMHRNPKYFANPNQFSPERFDHDFLKTIPAYAYFPFGGGPRVCIGNNFALMEAAIIVAVVGQRYRLQLLDSHSVKPEPLITLRVQGGLPMKVMERNQHA